MNVGSGGGGGGGRVCLRACVRVRVCVFDLKSQEVG